LGQISSSLSYHGQKGLFFRLQATTQHIQHLAPSLFYRTSVGHTVRPFHGFGRLSVYMRGSNRHVVHETGVEGVVSFRSLSVGFSGGYDTQWDGFTGGMHLRMETSMGSITARHTGLHASGGIEVSRGLTFLRAGNRESSATLRIFEDRDADGYYDTDETILPHVDAQLFRSSLQRQSDGTLHASFLEAYATYQVQIIEQSIHDPQLTPVTGYTFSFIADPGHTKIIDIPLTRPLIINGRVDRGDRPPARLHVQVYRQNTRIHSAAVYHDGGFTLQLDPGIYTVHLIDRVTEEQVATQELTVSPDSLPATLVFSLDR